MPALKFCATLRSHPTTVVLVVTLALTGATPASIGRAFNPANQLILVTTTADELNQDGDCSLREAVRAVNTARQVDACPAGLGEDTIVLQEGVYHLTIAGVGEDAGLQGDLDLMVPVTIRGAGAENTVVDGGGLDRIFHVMNSATIKSLTVQNGHVTGSGLLYGGGGVLNQAGTLVLDMIVIRENRSTGNGGGLDNSGTATLINSTVTQNQADRGGGIFNDGTLTISRSLLEGNSAVDTGGALDNGGTSTLTNVTISGNSATSGGGIFNDGAGLTLLNNTIVANSTALDNASNARIKNTIIAASTMAANCTGSGVYTSEGHNIDSENVCNFTSPTDLVNASPGLGPLIDNGGPTLTYALNPDSLAIDAGDALDCPAYDQRGAVRPADGDKNGSHLCDVGAFELDGSLPQGLFLPLVAR